MSEKRTLTELEAAFNAATTESGMKFNAEIVDGEVLQIVVDDREEFPVFVTIDDGQILCVSNLWNKSEIREGADNELNTMLLELNLPVPLSAFAITRGGQYCIYGSLSPASIIDNVVLEVETLSDNTLSAIEEFSEYLQ